jgi:hypothetical protein
LRSISPVQLSTSHQAHETIEMPSKAFDDSTAGEDEDRFQEITSDDDEDGEGKGGKDEESFQDAEEPVDEMKESSVGSKPPPSHVGGEGDSGVGTSGQGSKDKEETTEGEKEDDETVVWYDSMSTAVRPVTSFLPPRLPCAFLPKGIHIDVDVNASNR